MTQTQSRPKLSSTSRPQRALAFLRHPTLAEKRPQLYHKLFGHEQATPLSHEREVIHASVRTLALGPPRASAASWAHEPIDPRGVTDEEPIDVLEEQDPGMALGALPDDMLLLIIAACGEGPIAMPELDAMCGLGCLCWHMVRQLYRLQPLVYVRVNTTAKHFTQGPWRVRLLYTGELSMAVMQQATRGHVHSISTRRTALSPELCSLVVPELLGEGCSLLELRLEGVRLNGSWAETFGGAAVCSAVLRELQLDDCRLRGPMPTLQLPALQILWLSGNQLTGDLEPLRGCTALQELNLSHNALTGGLEPLRECQHLHGVDLSHNQLTGSLDPLRGCKSLQELYLANNHLGGSLDPLRDCSKLQKLVLDGNQLTGSLEPLRGCRELQKVYIRAGSRRMRLERMRHNQLTGGLDPLRGCTKLQMLVLDGNQLTGGLEPLRGRTKLQVLGMGGNQLTGSLEPLAGCTALQKLYLSKNQMTGGLEPLRGCVALQVLAMSNNKLTGDLEPLWGCTKLQKVYLTHNQFEGELALFEGSTILRELYLSNNQLTGTLSPLAGCRALQMLHLYDNQLTGGLEPLMGLTLLQELFLADNNLTASKEEKVHFEHLCQLSCI